MSDEFLQGDLAMICTGHLRDEETLVTAALAIVRAMQASFGRPGAVPLSDALNRLPDFGKLLGEIHGRRQRFCEALARRLQCEARAVTVETVVNVLPIPDRAGLRDCVDRIKRLTNELVAANHWLAIHLRIHLDTYQRFLRELTGSAGGSGRYGPAGTIESCEFRPLIQLHG